MSNSECSSKCYVIFHQNWGALWWEHSKLRALMSTSLVEWEPFRFSKWFSFYVMVLIFKRFSFLPTIHRERETGNGHFVSKFNFKCQIQNIQQNAMPFFIKTEGHSKCMTFITMFTAKLTHNIKFSPTLSLSYYFNQFHYSCA